MRPSFYSFGVIDILQVEAHRVVCHGWVVAGARAIDALEVSVGGTSIGRIDGPLMPSPDVAQAWPHLPTSAQCRFAIQIRLTDEQLANVSRHEVVAIVPLCRNERGVPLERVLPLRFTAASAVDSEAVGKGDFIHTAFEFLSVFRHFADLQRDETVLDVGCGIGRMAFGLAHYLGPSARYEGFDVSSPLIQSARARYAELSQFEFRHADVYNRMYNPLGKLEASTFRFPYPDSTFSFVLLTSVFTHMVPRELAHYLREIRRVLRHDGRVVATLFALDREAKELIDAGRCTIPLAGQFEGCPVSNPAVPEEAIVYPRSRFRAMVEDAGLRLEAIHPGLWSGRTDFLSYQDVALLRLN